MWPDLAQAIEYRSPENLMGEALDVRSEVYSLGVLAYELVTGRLPFHDARGPAGLITAQLEQQPQPPSRVVPDLPPEVDAAIQRCLEKDPALRHADVGALADALAAIA